MVIKALQKSYCGCVTCGIPLFILENFRISQHLLQNKGKIVFIFYYILFSVILDGAHK